MEPLSLEESRNLLIILLLFFTVANFVLLFPEINKRVRLFRVKYKYKKQRIKKTLANNLPPKATFFSRTNGKYLMIEGPYEDKYLSKWKRKIWRRNKKNELQTVDKKDKTD